MRRVSALLMFAIVSSAALAAQSRTADSTTDAAVTRLEKLVGQTARVCGAVVEHVCRPDDDSRLALGSLSTEPGATILVPPGARARFPLAFERRMLGRNVCATGPISRQGIRFFVLVEDPASISTEPVDEPKDLPPDLVSSCDKNVVIPKLLKAVKAEYPTNALNSGVKGTVWMDAIVGVDGRPSALRITRSLDSKLGFDQAAAAALQQWRFAPGTHEGKPVPVHIGVSMTFTTR